MRLHRHATSQWHRTALEVAAVLNPDLQSFRNQGIFYEHVTNTILDDLVGILRPRWMRIEAAFNARGGMTETVTAKYANTFL